jgi:hypothetical protein
MQSKLGHGTAAALLLAACLPAATATASLANGMRPTDIFVLGDSQLAFGSGPAIQGFLDEFEKSCAGNGPPPRNVPPLTPCPSVSSGFAQRGCVCGSRERKGARA